MKFNYKRVIHNTNVKIIGQIIFWLILRIFKIQIKKMNNNNKNKHHKIILKIVLQILIINKKKKKIMIVTNVSLVVQVMIKKNNIRTQKNNC